MPNLIESLESRMLLSATPAAVSALFTQGKAVIADGKLVVKADAAGLKAIGAELKAAKLTKTDAVALRTLLKADVATGKLVSNDVTSTEKVVGADVDKLVADANALAKNEAAKKPNATVTAKLTAAITALKTVLSTEATDALAKFTNDASTFQTTVDTDSSALSSPSQTALDGAITSYQSGLATPLHTLELAVTTALTTDVTSVLALY